MFKQALIVAALAAAPATASAETWRVTEGPGAAVQGAWNVTISGAAVSGNAMMNAAQGKKLTYGVSGALKDGGFILQRQRPSDGVACTYVGKPQGARTIQGNAICNGANTPWMVTRMN